MSKAKVLPASLTHLLQFWLWTLTSLATSLHCSTLCAMTSLSCALSQRVSISVWYSLISTKLVLRQCAASWISLGWTRFRVGSPGLSRKCIVCLHWSMMSVRQESLKETVDYLKHIYSKPRIRRIHVSRILGQLGQHFATNRTVYTVLTSDKSACQFSRNQRLRPIVFRGKFPGNVYCAYRISEPNHRFHEVKCR